MRVMWVSILGLWEWILCKLCSVNRSETFDSCIKDNLFLLLAFQIFLPNWSFVFAFVLPFIMKLSYSFHVISYVPFPFYGLWVFYFMGVKQGVSSGPRWSSGLPDFIPKSLSFYFFTFSSLFHPKFAFILCIVWGRGSTLFSCIWIELCQHKSPQITVLIREIVNVQCMNILILWTFIP